VFASVNGELIWHQRVEEKDKNGHPTHDHAVVVTVSTPQQCRAPQRQRQQLGPRRADPMALFIRAWNASDKLMAVTT